MKWRMAVCSTSGDACCTRALSRPSRPSRPTGWPSRSNAWRTRALRGEVWDKAVTCCQQAGVRAYDRAAFREAVAAFEQALQALAHLPESGDTRALAIELRLALQGLLSVVGEFGRCRVLLGEAEALARGR